MEREEEERVVPLPTVQLVVELRLVKSLSSGVELGQIDTVLCDLRNIPLEIEPEIVAALLANGFQRLPEMPAGKKFPFELHITDQRMSPVVSFLRNILFTRGISKHIYLEVLFYGREWFGAAMFRWHEFAFPRFVPDRIYVTGSLEDERWWPLQELVVSWLGSQPPKTLVEAAARALAGCETDGPFPIRTLLPKELWEMAELERTSRTRWVEIPSSADPLVKMAL